MAPSIRRVSKFLSLVLRHQPARAGLQLDAQGWVDIGELLAGIAAHTDLVVDRGLLREVVETNDKQRFAISDDGARIRANQGHSIAVDLELPECTPPAELFHGTATRFLPAIEQAGLLPGTRHDVHLSADRDTARRVGRRHGAPVVLTVQAAAMVAAGRRFRRSANGVWLAPHVPPQFLVFPVDSE